MTMSNSTPPDTFPITGICIVSDPDKCPPGYELLLKSHDRHEDCDLWKDSFFKSRVLRYLCITRAYPLNQGKLNNVLLDIIIQNDREVPPRGFTLLEKTQDSQEKATRKKQICVRMMPRESANAAITQIVILSRNKRPPQGYTLAGEVNGLVLCFKIDSVPSESVETPETPPVEANPPAATYALSGNSSGSSSSSSINKTNQNALYDVPFQLHPSYQSMRQNNNVPVPEISYRSSVDINNEYNYPFQLEISATQRVN